MPGWLTFRRAALADRAAMLDICATVWEGEDYLPAVFDAWVADPSGMFVAGEMDGRVVALGRCARLGPGEHWLEGIRVHPDWRGQGVAGDLHDYVVAHIREPGTLRLATGADNEPVVRLCERRGFAKILTYTFAAAPAADTVVHGFQPVRPDESETALACLQRSPFYAETRGLCDHTWKWKALTPAYLAEQTAAGRVYRWRDWEGVLMVAPPIEGETGDPILSIHFPGVSEARLAEFLAETRALAKQLDRPRVRWSPTLRTMALPALSQAGFTRLWEDVLICFELRL